MIDFRYHLVSIISIFLALAVGIVLGAGPLQSNLGSTLGDQVTALRNEKQDLNTKLTDTQKQLAAAAEFETAITPSLVAGRLSGHGVILVVLPSVESKLVDSTSRALAQSGAKVHGTVTLSADWFDPAKASERAKAAAAAAAALDLRPTKTGDQLLTEVLGRLTVSELPLGTNADRDKAMAELSDAGLLDSSDPQLTPADLAVVVSGDHSGSQSEVDAWSERVRALALRLESGSQATVVVGGAPVQAAGKAVSTDAVSAVRSDRRASAAVSTVDHAGVARGPAVTVLAIEAQLADQVGHYGTAPGADAILPKVSP
ncbi:MAG: copper transporter [Intrasporangium sp.]|uniref:copper transporter n=1 Tax=Intrasporangium sp. TaxID=1925024 RepID=UPI00264A2CFB|nr:copper transporter [Intrasporangium sp.]MDN5794188.1 copper transporter [Intrasporangium sp.]